MKVGAGGGAAAGQSPASRRPGGAPGYAREGGRAAPPMEHLRQAERRPGEMEYQLMYIDEAPEWLERAAAWFHQKWGIPLEAYRESMEESLRTEQYPRWLVAVRGERILGGLGVIQNDFHDRRDLSPNVCAVYVEEDCRGRGLAGVLLQAICDSMAERGIKTLYLLTDHTHFYERYGWEYLCDAMGEGEDTPSRMYRKRTE